MCTYFNIKYISAVIILNFMPASVQFIKRYFVVIGISFVYSLMLVHLLYVKMQHERLTLHWEQQKRFIHSFGVAYSALLTSVTGGLLFWGLLVCAVYFKLQRRFYLICTCLVGVTVVYIYFNF